MIMRMKMMNKIRKLTLTSYWETQPLLRQNLMRTGRMRNLMMKRKIIVSNIPRLWRNLKIKKRKKEKMKYGNIS